MVKRQYFAKLNGTASCQDGGAISRKSSLLGYVRLASVELQLNRFQLSNVPAFTLSTSTPLSRTNTV
jgi:hypothetical protein